MQLLRPTLLRCVLLVSLFGVAPSAHAEPPPARSNRNGNLTEFQFDDDLVRGDGYNPNAEHLFVRRGKPKESLVRARSHFIDQLLKSVESL